jgi:hypothetical protein
MYCNNTINNKKTPIIKKYDERVPQLLIRLKLCNEKVQTTFIWRLDASFDPIGDDLIRAFVDDINSSYLFYMLDFLMWSF